MCDGGEIILRNNGLCNLSEVVVRSEDNFETLRRKVRIAAIIGTFQSTLTNFRYVRNIWKHNAEEERLLGVSLTGILDHPVLSKSTYFERHPDGLLVDWLKELKEHAIQTNNHWASILGINPSAAITTVKPSGTVSQLVNSASGIHPRYSEYYLRSVRADKTDPLAQFLITQGVPVEDDITKPNNTYIFYFPIKSPSTSVFRDGMTALEQLELYLTFKENWCEHNVSCTVYVREHEWLEVGAWVYKYFNDIGGLSFLPHTDHIYKQAPYQEITKEKYETLVATFPKIKWEDFHEEYDGTTGTQELACVAGICEI